MRLKGIMRLNGGEGGKAWGGSAVGMDLGGGDGFRMEWNWSKTRPGFGLRVNGGISIKGGVKPGMDRDGNGMDATQRDNATG